MANRKDMSALAALLAVTALLVQALLPTAALARSSAADPSAVVTICTGAGVKTVAIDAERPTAPHDSGFIGGSCANCLAAASIALLPPTAVAVPVAWERGRVAWSAQPAVAGVHARGPPRPFSQGPPRNA